MTRSRLSLLVTLPWIAAGAVLLVATKLQHGGSQVHWLLFGSGMICFSIGCLARTSLSLAQPPRQNRRP
jgi:cyanate permease